MRKIRYRVASSLDGYIAGSSGETDWIVHDAAIDFGALLAQFDALLVGRRTFEVMMDAGRPTMLGMKTLVFSRTMTERKLPKNVEFVVRNHTEFVEELRSRPGKDIWLFGGGIPLFPANGAAWKKLRLNDHRIYRESGIVSLSYDVIRDTAW